MNKDELVRQVAKKTGLTNKEAKNIIQNTFDIISQSLSDGERVKITGFGTFAIKKRGGFKACNSVTGDLLNVQENIKPIFEPSKKLKEKVNKSK